MASTEPNPPESLVNYGEPIFTGDTVDPGKKSAQPPPTDFNTAQRIESLQRVEDSLNAMLPPQIWHDEDSGYWIRYPSPTPSSRHDVIKLQEAMDAKLLSRQARDSGICAVREDLYSQCFDELIRQVTLNSPERGLLLLRVRDELRLTTEAYKTLYDSSTIFAIRKQLQAEEGMDDLQAHINLLKEEKKENELKVQVLTNKLELVEKRAAEKKAIQDKKFKEEIEFLKYQGQHLDAFYKSVGGNTSVGSK